jgi:hypothetical protein
MKTRLALALLVAALPAASALSQEGSTTTAGQTVVIPNLPGIGNNQEIRIAGQEIVNAEITGPEVAVTAEVVQWEEGRSITVRLPDGSTRVVPVPSTIIFPPGLRPGLKVTFLVRQTSDGRYRVTGLTTGATSAPALVGVPPAAPPAPEKAGAPPPAPSEISPAPPPPALTPPPSPPKGAAVLGAAYMSVRGTVTAFEEGVSITIKEKSGRVRTLKLTPDAKVADDVAVGTKIRARIPLQKPFDGKTADKVSRDTPPKTPIPSMFKGAESPKN